MKLCIGLCDDNPLHLRMISQEIQRLCGMIPVFSVIL